MKISEFQQLNQTDCKSRCIDFLPRDIGMHLLDSYEKFLLQNAAQISSVESSLRSLTYVLPGFITVMFTL